MGVDIEREYGEEVDQLARMYGVPRDVVVDIVSYYYRKGEAMLSKYLKRWRCDMKDVSRTCRYDDVLDQECVRELCEWYYWTELDGYCQRLYDALERELAKYIKRKHRQVGYGIVYDIVDTFTLDKCDEARIVIDFEL